MCYLGLDGYERTRGQGGCDVTGCVIVEADSQVVFVDLLHNTVTKNGMTDALPGEPHGGIV